MKEAACPCGGESYATCCEPFHRGTEPPDPERLMRSRYSAFVKRDIAYLWRTLHPQHDERASSFATYAAFEQSMRAFFAKKPVYQRLEVLATTPPDDEGVATVTFRVALKVKGRDAGFWERSSFARDEGGWRYLVGQTR